MNEMIHTFPRAQDTISHTSKRDENKLCIFLLSHNCIKILHLNSYFYFITHIKNILLKSKKEVPSRIASHKTFIFI